MKLPVYATGKITIECPRCGVTFWEDTSEMQVFKERDYGGEYTAVEIRCNHCGADLRLKG